MKPIGFPESNVTLRTPPDLTVEECDELPVYVDGLYVISCWQPSEAERSRLAAGAPVWLWVWSPQSQPPVALSTDCPFRGQT